MAEAIGTNAEASTVNIQKMEAFGCKINDYKNEKPPISIIVFKKGQCCRHSK